MADRGDILTRQLVRLIYDDRTAKWVPFATAGIIVMMVWGSIVWNEGPVRAATILSLLLAVILLVGIFLQGWVYWNGQIETLSFDGATAEARTMRWVGFGRKVRFAPGDATGWRTVAKSSDATALSSIEFTASGTALSMSFLNPKLVDLEGCGHWHRSFRQGDGGLSGLLYGGGGVIVTVRVIVTGKVQGVGFRNFTLMQAKALRIDGLARNRSDGTVEALLLAEPAVIARMLIALRVGPPHSAVINVRSEPVDGQAVEPGFGVRPTE